MVTVAMGGLGAGCTETVVTGTCPPTAPTMGNACSPSGMQCNYDPCGMYHRTYADCRDGRWNVMSATCNPPVPTDSAVTDVSTDAVVERDTTPVTDVPPTPDLGNPPPPVMCPPSAPTTGASCASPGQRCNYGPCGMYFTTYAECTSAGAWQVNEASCNPPPPTDAGGPDA